MAKYSIVIPVYNTEVKYLRICLDSVLAQTYGNWEIIIVDDGSTRRDTIDCCDLYGRSRNIRVYHKENEGQYAARYFGICVAQGDYVCFLDSDDYWRKDLLETVDCRIEKTSCDMAMFRYERPEHWRKLVSPRLFPDGTVIGDGGKSKDVLLPYIAEGNRFNNLWLKVVKSNLAQTIDGKKYKEVIYGEDLVLSLQILEKARRIVYIDKILYYYRITPGSITTSSFTCERAKKNMEDNLLCAKIKLAYLTKHIASSELMGIYYSNCLHGRLNLLRRYIELEADERETEKWVSRMFSEDFKEGCKKYLKTAEVNRKDRKWYKKYILGDGAS